MFLMAAMVGFFSAEHNSKIADGVTAAVLAILSCVPILVAYLQFAVMRQMAAMRRKQEENSGKIDNLSKPHPRRSTDAGEVASGEVRELREKRVGGHNNATDDIPQLGWDDPHNVVQSEEVKVERDS
jgi:hypothetical protein